MRGFFDPSRVSLPDIDSDFQDTRRQEVIDYVVEKYGRENVSQIITFGTMAARSAIRSVGRALNLPYMSYDQISKMIPAEINITIEKALEINPDLKRKYLSDDKAKDLIDIAMSLEGLPLNTSTHAAGVLITDNRGVTEHVPLWNNKGAVVAQYDKNILDDLRLLKMDFLGLITMGVIGEAIDFVEQNHGIGVDLDELYKVRDLKPLSLIGLGRTDGIFQLQGGGMTQFMKELNPKNLEELSLGIAIYRPGPMQFIPELLNNRRNPSNIKYTLSGMEGITGDTFGILTFQEQLMRTVIAIAGYGKGDSDNFRKVVAK